LRRIGCAPSHNGVFLGPKTEPAPGAETNAIMFRRDMTMGNVKDELGFKRLNPSLGLALSQNSRLQLEMLDAVEKWVAAYHTPVTP
jgi:hypothetical protein